MEKINNYTPGQTKTWLILQKNRITNQLELSGVIHDVDAHKAFVKNLELELIYVPIELSALAPTLYEQHFKMLEALKKIVDELKSDDKNLSTFKRDLLREAKQTIKECEL